MLFSWQQSLFDLGSVLHWGGRGYIPVKGQWIKKRGSCAAAQALQWDLLAKIIMSGQWNRIDVYHIIEAVPWRLYYIFHSYRTTYKKKPREALVWYSFALGAVVRGKDSERQMQDPCAGSIESSLSVQNLPSPLELPHNSAQALQLRPAEPSGEGGCVSVLWGSRHWFWLMEYIPAKMVIRPSLRAMGSDKHWQVHLMLTAESRLPWKLTVCVCCY